jgi:serine/threonine protein kinase
MGKEEKIEKGDNNEVTFNEEEQKGKFVVMDEGFNMELEDLLRASAYVVGKSRSGIVYKVVVGGGGSGTAMPTVVAVRRLSEGDATWKLKEFESEVEAIERVHHPNIARLRAYYFAHDEKLLVSDFIRNGSLYSALHGNISLILLVIIMLYWTLTLNFNNGPLHMLQVNTLMFLVTQYSMSIYLFCYLFKLRSK